MKLKFHHINLVTDDVDKLYHFYANILNLDEVPIENFPRTEASDSTGYSGRIKFVTDGQMQMHLAERDINVAKNNGMRINPVKHGHIAFRTEDIGAFKRMLNKKSIPYSDYGNAFSKEWHQLFFYDPEGKVVEVHQAI